MCDEIICSEAGIGLCEDDRILLEKLGEGRNKAETDKRKKEEENNNEVAETNRNVEEGEDLTDSIGEEAYFDKHEHLCSMVRLETLLQNRFFL